MNVLQERAGAVLTAIEAHAFSDTRTEVGGVLVGNLEEDGARVLAALPALKAVGGQTNVTFTHEVWEEVLDLIDRDHPGQQIVGWYHTHPGFGLFLSEYDMFIHRNFFTDPRMVALVIDPLAGELGWFGWDGDEVALQEQHPTTRDALRAVSADGTASAEATAQRRRPAALVAVPAIAILGAIGGYLLSAHTADLNAATQSRRIAVAHEQTQAARNEGDQLRRQLAAATATKPDATSPTTTHPGTATNVRYRVQRGDTLWRVAQSLYGSGNAYGRIAKANPSVRAQGLHEGQVLIVPLTDANITKR